MDKNVTAASLTGCWPPPHNSSDRPSPLGAASRRVKEVAYATTGVT